MFNKKSRWMVALVALPAAALTIGLTGCTSGTGDNATAAGSGSNASASQSHLTQILKSKELRVAVSPDTVGWGAKTASGTYEGYDIDAAKALADSLGAKIKYVNATDASRIPLLLTDKVDVVIDTFTAKNSRAQQVDMSIPYAANGDAIVVPKDSSIKKLSDLDGKTVATSAGSAAESVLKTQFPKAKETTFNSIADTVQAMKSGKVDAMIENTTTVDQVVSQSAGKFIVLTGKDVAESTYSMGVKPGDQRWLNYLNNFIRNYVIGGDAQTSYSKWFHGELPDFLY